MQNNTFFGYSTPTSLIVLDKISSTNDYIKHLLTNFKPQLPFTAIMAKEQTEGRGQRGTSWLAKPKENLTASFLYSPTNLQVKDQFILTILTSLAIYDTLKACKIDDIYIKWPNDIIANNKKIAGVLIENKISSTHIKHSIIGIGINVYSTEFPVEINQKTTSIRLENFDFSMTIIDVILSLQKRLLAYDKLYSSGQIDKLWQLYTQKLFRKNMLSTYIINTKLTQGRIITVQQDGRLVMEVDNKIEKYDLKNVEYQL